MNDSLSKGERTSQTILEAAYSLFLEQGFHATSMRQIAQRAGIAVGGIYNHFSSKEAIFDRVLVEKHPYRQVVKILQAAPGETMEAFAINGARTLLAELGRRPDFLKLVFIELSEFKGEHVPILFQMVYPQIAPLIQRFKERQHELRDLPLPVIMQVFLGTFFAYYLAKYLVTPGVLQELEGVALEQYIDIFLHGIIDPTYAQPAERP
jgi:AcrR family transcriptional regulator